MAKSPLDTVLTIAELSKYLKISRSTLYKLAQEGKLPAQKVGRHWRFHREAVDAWLKNEKPNG
ncbi:MAG: helix-turn-helix domain-containing protein [Planctomycetes bacterium]|nr:helix-turn-helix domain-containing protein [Planctomycetota bacterium]